MGDDKVTGQASNITISKESDPGLIETDWRKLASAAPGPLGSGFSAFDSTQKALSDGKVTGGEIAGLASAGAGFVSSCMDVSSIATDPIGWLVGQGLNFLMSVVTPIQDAIHLVSGDGPALSNAAGNFGSIAQGLAAYSQKFAQDAQASLTQWSGQAAETAGTKLGEFSHGINGIAAQAGDIAQLLQISSMVMTVIEEFIKAILTELITWLIMIWIPALAAAVPTAGASVASAGTASTVRGVQTTSKVGRYVQKLRELLDRIRQFLTKMKEFFSTLGKEFQKNMGNKAMRSSLAKLEKESAKEAGETVAKRTRLMSAEGGMIGERVYQGGAKSFGNEALKSGLDNVGLGGLAKEGKIKLPTDATGWTKIGLKVTGKGTKYASEGGKIADYGEPGEDQSTEETSKDLDF
ncbi:hypothetical protein [Amycolatopsis pithecellobii]|uniref:WXG100 family type VII secretion target n=1 Tax=Amycolatopsis pithecellobii TaxID=664692 RepID=A0A6N7Z0D5_9PSEU|nr:hypothetical protein [Amycolatopsis pithecellobii]MTD57748.1 hypothetical protein [Amycolatopsis pithecellobii]